MKSSAFNVLSQEEIKTIHEKSFEILETTGIRVNLKKLRQLLADHGAFVDETSKTVKFPSSLIEKHLATIPESFEICGYDSTFRRTVSTRDRVWSGLGTAFRMLDPKTNTWQDSTQEDAEKHIILFDSLEHVSSNQMDVFAQDIPMHTVHVEGIRGWAKNCRKGFGMGAYGVMASTDMVEMLSLAIGGKDKLQQDHPFVTIISIHSPLSSAQIQLEGMMLFAEHKIPMCMSPEAMAGTTAPVTLAGLLVQHNAEILAHLVMAQIINPGTPVLYGSVSTIAEMRRGTAALGSIECGMISTASAQLAHYFNIPCRAVAGGSESKTVDVQAGLERSQSMLMTAMGGANYITAVGTLESTNLGAHALSVIDNEIIGRVERAIRGIEVNDVSMALEEIKRVGPEGNYLMEAHTQQHFRSEHFMTRITDRDQLEIWEKGGRKSMLDLAMAEAEKIFSNHQPRQLDPRLAEELDKFVAMVNERTVDDYYNAEWED